MDTVNLFCSSKANYSVGHMSAIQNYGFGHYEFEVKSAHKPDGGLPALDAFSCVSIYTGTSS